MSISRSRPLKTPGGLLEGEQRVGGRLQLGVERRRAVERRDAGAQRGGDRRRGFGERLGPRLERGEEAFGVVQEGAQRRQVGGRPRRGSAGLSRSFPGCRGGRRGRRRRRCGRGRRRGSACVSATGATVAESASSARQKPPKSVLGATRSREDRLAAFDQLAQGAERFVQLRAAAGEGVAEAGQVALDRCRGSSSSNMSKNWSMSTGSGLRRGERDRFAGREAFARSRRG